MIASSFFVVVGGQSSGAVKMAFLRADPHLQLRVRSVTALQLFHDDLSIAEILVQLLNHGLDAYASWARVPAIVVLTKPESRSKSLLAS